jgi:hypothetical protein
MQREEEQRCNRYYCRKVRVSSTWLLVPVSEDDERGQSALSATVPVTGTGRLCLSVLREGWAAGKPVTPREKERKRAKETAGG